METVFFVASKVVGTLIRPDTWLVLAVFMIVVVQLLDRRRAAAALGCVTLAVLLALSLLPLGDMMIRPFESAYPADPPLDRVDGIVVLGGAEDVDAAARWRQPQVNEGGDRFLAAIDLARRFPQARVVFTGGSGRLRHLGGGGPAESRVAAQILAAGGVQGHRVLLEDKARNTAENAVFARALAQPANGEVWVLVTSAFHMPRAMQSFAAAGWTGIVAYPVDHRSRAFADGVEWNLTRNLHVLQLALKEHVGLLAYRLGGR